MSSAYYPLTFIIFQLIFTYGISSLVIYQVFCRLLQAEGENKRNLLIYSFGLGPVSISWIVTMLFLALPGYSNWVYIGFVNLLYLIPFICFRRYLSSLPQFAKKAWSQLCINITREKTAYFILFLGLILVGVGYFLAIFLPYSENDALEYAMLAKIMYSEHSARMYPIMNGAEYGGFIAPFTHPLAYSSLFVWSYLIQGTAEHFGLIKIVAPFYASCIFALIINLLSPTNKKIAFWSALLFISTPLLLNGIIRHQIDPLRLYTFFAFFMFLQELTACKKWKIILPAGFLLGMCLYSHSIGVLAIPIFGFIYLFFSREPIIQRLKKVFFVTLLGLLFVAPRYAINIYTTGYLIHDGTIVRTVPTLHFSEIYEIINEISTNAQKWINGFFSLFYNTLYFGFSYIVLILALIFIRKKDIQHFFIDGISGKDRIQASWNISFLVVMCFFGMVILSILIKNNNFIASNRYMMSVQPFIAILGGWGITRLLECFQFRYKALIPLAGSALIFILAFSFPANSVFDYKLSLNTLFDDDEVKAKHAQDTYNLLEFYRNNAPKDSILLSFRNAEAAFYANKQYFYHTDPRMLPVYTAKSKWDTYKALVGLGIQYIAVPNYPLSYIDQSYISQVLGDPGIAKLIYQHGGAKLYELLPNPITYKLDEVFINNKDFSKLSQKQELINWLIYSGGEIKRDRKTEGGGIHIINISSFPTLSYILSGSKGWYGGSFGRFLSNQHKGDIALNPNQTYQLSTKIKGYGNLIVYLAEYSEEGYLGLQKIWQTILFNKETIVKTAQFQTGALPKNYRLVFVLTGKGRANIQDMDLAQVHYPTSPEHDLQIKNNLINAGWRILSPIPARAYFDRLKRLFGFQSTYMNYIDKWQAFSDGKDDTIQLAPQDSNLYVISGPMLPYPSKKLSDIRFSIKGQGEAMIEIIGDSFQGNTFSAYRKRINLSEKYQDINIKLTEQDFEKYVDINTEISGYRLVISYKKPAYFPQGDISLKIGKPDLTLVGNSHHE